MPQPSTTSISAEKIKTHRFTPSVQPASVTTAPKDRQGSTSRWLAGHDVRCRNLGTLKPPCRPRKPIVSALEKPVRNLEKAVLQSRFCPASLSSTQLQNEHSFKVKRGLEFAGKTKVLQHPFCCAGNQTNHAAAAYRMGKGLSVVGAPKPCGGVQGCCPMRGREGRSRHPATSVANFCTAVLTPTERRPRGASSYRNPA